MTTSNQKDPVSGDVDAKSGAVAEAVPSRGRLLSATGWLTIILGFMYMIMYLDRVNISVTAKDMMKEFSLNNTQMGLAFSAFSYPYLFGQLFGGWFANKVGPRLTLALCALVVAVSDLSMGFVTGFVSLFIVRLFLGLGEGPAFSAATQAMRHWYPERRFGFIQGMTHSAARFGGAVGPPIVAWLMIISSWRVAFWLSGLVYLAWIVVWWRFFRDDPRDHPQITEAELSKLKPPLKAAQRGKTPFGALAKRILPVTAVDFCYGWMLWVFISWIPLYYMKKHGLNLKTSALLAGLTFGAGVIGDTLGGTFSDWIVMKTGNKRLARNAFIAFCLIVSGVFLYATMQTLNITYVVLLLGGSFFFLELVVGTIWAIPMDISREYAGICGGMMNFGFALAGIISPVVFGFVIDRTHSWDVPFMISVGICAVGAALTVFMRPDLPFIAPQTAGMSKVD